MKNKREEGAYAVDDRYGHQVLFLFEEEDDAERYAMMLEDQEDKMMDVIEVDDALAIKTCRMHNYKYAVITSDDFVIPPIRNSPKNDNISKD